MAQLKNDEWPADNEPTTTEDQERMSIEQPDARGHVPFSAETEPDDSELMNIRPDEATD